MAFELEFGFRPSCLDLKIGPVTIETLDGLQGHIDEVEKSGQMYKEWIYAPLQPIKNSGTRQIYNDPNRRRVFGLPNTHIIRHVEDVELEYLQFHIWSLGFFTGQRLSATEAGFLDATPFQPGRLNDFLLMNDGLSRAVQLAEKYWKDNVVHNRKQLARFEAAIHALFLAQNPRLLQFEEFILFYTALDACYAIMEHATSSSKLKHQQRTKWMCNHYSIPLPDWADPDGGAQDDGSEIAALRNPTIHEGLYMGEPLGFAIKGKGSSRNLNLEMQALICRLLVAIIGGAETDYVRSAVTSRQLEGLILP